MCHPFLDKYALFCGLWSVLARLCGLSIAEGCTQLFTSISYRFYSYILIQQKKVTCEKQIAMHFVESKQVSPVNGWGAETWKKTKDKNPKEIDYKLYHPQNVTKNFCWCPSCLLPSWIATATATYNRNLYYTYLRADSGPYSLILMFNLHISDAK